MILYINVDNLLQDMPENQNSDLDDPITGFKTVNLYKANETVKASNSDAT